MTKRKPWETPENGANEPLARKLADLGPLMRETADADNEPPDPAFLERLKDALLREHWPTLEDDAPKQDQ